ncbi:hypothetical protein ACQ3I4_08975 [Zafaria sp. Z1313]|uniref:hypothetical protein n=1 Tax=unclassified Zafaria TaxID=2828765 RepID=UPI002E75BDD6|nr:hypothetical protein [Zafaria sp. J156]MEE1621665.1 hypothetical protein [Zafaria sp. J156]
MQSSIRTSRGLLAAAFAAVGLVVGTASTFIVAGLIGAGTAGSYALATKIVDAIMVGASAAAIAALLLTAGLGTAVIATVRWAIGFFGRKKAIA